MGKEGCILIYDYPFRVKLQGTQKKTGDRGQWPVAS